MTYLELQRQKNSKPIATNKIVATPTSIVTHSGIGLIDKLADDSKDDMVEIVQEFFNDSLGVSGDEMGLIDPNKIEIKQRVGQLLSKINDDGGLTKETLNKFLQDYRGTSLPITAKVMRLTFLIQNARTMNPAEQENSFKIIQGLARAVTDGRMQTEEVTDLIDGLTNGQFNSVARFRNCGSQTPSFVRGSKSCADDWQCSPMAATIVGMHYGTKLKEHSAKL